MLLLKTLEALSSHPHHQPFFGGPVSATLTQRLLMPCLVWRSGHTAAAIRGSCMTLLRTFLEQGWLETPALASLLQVWPPAHTCLQLP